MIELAAEICKKADIFVLIGTSLAVYPAAGLLHFVPPAVPKYVIDPVIPNIRGYQNIIPIEKGAVNGITELLHVLVNG